MNYQEFSAKVKAKYPQYKDIDDVELAKKMIAKFPGQYADVEQSLSIQMPDMLDTSSVADATAIRSRPQDPQAAVKPEPKPPMFGSPLSARSELAAQWKGEGKRTAELAETGHPIRSFLHSQGGLYRMGGSALMAPIAATFPRASAAVGRLAQRAANVPLDLSGDVAYGNPNVNVRPSLSELAGQAAPIAQRHPVGAEIAGDILAPLAMLGLPAGAGMGMRAGAYYPGLTGTLAGKALTATGQQIKKGGRKGLQETYKITSPIAKQAGLTHPRGEEKILDWMDEFELEGRPKAVAEKAQAKISKAEIDADKALEAQIAKTPNEVVNSANVLGDLRSDLINAKIPGTAMIAPEAQSQMIDQIAMMLDRKGLYGDIPLSKVPELKQVIKQEIGLFAKGAVTPETNALKRIGDEYYRRVKIDLENKVPGFAKPNNDIHRLIIVRDASEDAAKRIGHRYDLGLRELLTMGMIPGAVGVAGGATMGGEGTGAVIGAMAMGGGAVAASKKLLGGGRIPAAQMKIGRTIEGLGKAIGQQPAIRPTPVPPPTERGWYVPTQRPLAVSPEGVAGVSTETGVPLSQILERRASQMGQEDFPGAPRMTAREIKAARRRLARLEERNRRLGETMEAPQEPAVSSERGASGWHKLGDLLGNERGAVGGVANKHELKTGEPVDIEALHGTSGNWDEYDLNKAGNTYGYDNMKGIFLTTSKENAESIAADASQKTGLAPNIKKMRVSLQNPLVIKTDKFATNYMDENYDNIIKKIDGGEHDGVIINSPEEQLIYVESPNQIKANPDIRGSFATAILGGMSAGGLTGATAGAQIGNTPEERARNAMLGAGAGMVGGGVLGQAGARGVGAVAKGARTFSKELGAVGAGRSLSKGDIDGLSADLQELERAGIPNSERLVEREASKRAIDAQTLLNGQTLKSKDDATEWLKQRGLHDPSLEKLVADKPTPTQLYEKVKVHPDFKKLSMFDRAKVIAMLERPVREKTYKPTAAISSKGNRKTIEEMTDGGYLSGRKIRDFDPIRGCCNDCPNCFAKGGADQAQITFGIPVETTTNSTLNTGEIFRTGVKGDVATNWNHAIAQVKGVFDRSIAKGQKVHPDKDHFTITKLQNIDGYSPEYFRNMEVSVDPLTPEHMARTFANVQKLKDEYGDRVNIALRIRSYASKNPELQASLDYAKDRANEMGLEVLETKMRWKNKLVAEMLEMDASKYEQVGAQMKMTSPALKDKVKKWHLCDAAGTGKCVNCRTCESLMFGTAKEFKFRPKTSVIKPKGQ